MMNGESTRLADTALSGYADEDKRLRHDELEAVPLSIVIVSNSQLFAQGLSALLASHIKFHLVAVYAVNKALEQVLPNPANHTVLIDSNMGLESALACIRHWRSQQPSPLVVVLETPPITATILRYIETGINGYSVHGDTVSEIAGVIEDARRGLARCSAKVAAELFLRVASTPKTAQVEAPPLPNCLTPREIDVLCCISMGYSNKEIAAKLVITVHTVKHHVHSILEKLELSHRRDAARLAVARGWVRNV